MAEERKKKENRKRLFLIVGVTPEGSRRNNVRPHPTVALSTMSSLIVYNVYSHLVIYNTVFRRIELSKKALRRESPPLAVASLVAIANTILGRSSVGHPFRRHMLTELTDSTQRYSRVRNGT